MPHVVTLSASTRSVELAHPADPVKLAELRADVFHEDIMGARSVPQLASGPVVVAAPWPHTDLIQRGHLQAPAMAAAAQGLRLAAGWGA
jgi:pentose-5-phosphate-3-epimerase